MQLQLQPFATIVANAVAAVQGTARQLLDLTVGSTLRVVLEANASLALWLQWLILQVLRTTRAATSQGADLDSWMADFTVTRLPPVAAYGVVTFARFTPGTTALIAAGATVRTADGSQTFIVDIDTTNPAWSAALNGYVLAAGIAAITLLVQAASPGSAGNVQANSITLLGTAIPGVDTVANAYPMQGGQDPESDTALRARFANFLASRSRATPAAIAYAIASVQQGLQYVVAENTASDGTSRPGTFTVTVDDGTGHPSSPLISNVAAAIETVRPTGSTYAVLPPAIVPATVSLSIITGPGSTHSNSVAAVTAALGAYINALPIAAPLAWSRLAQVAYSADPGVVNVTSVLLNNGMTDLVPPPTGVIKSGSIMVS